MLPVTRFTQFINQNQLFEANGFILAAVSGGMDSVLLTHLLKAAGYNFAIAHCNFQLRGAEADADQQFCRQLALDMQVPFHTVNFNTTAYAHEHKLSIQMAARQLRYQWFVQLNTEQAYTAVALAHHQNDAIETILLNLTRGTGIAGLHGILPKSGLWVRPLLFLSRKEIEEVMQQSRLAWREDSSNAGTKYARNKIRHEVIPHLQQLNPNLEQTFERNLVHFRQLEQLLQQQVTLAKKELWVQAGTDVFLDLQGINKLYPQRLLLLELFKDYGFNETAIDDLIATLPKHSGRVFESATHTLLLDRDKLILSPKDGKAPVAVSIYEHEDVKPFGNYTIHISYTNELKQMPEHQQVAAADADLLVYPLTLRAWQQGDSFVPLGMRGSKKLSDFFINQKVPLHQKMQVPLVVNGNGEVIWIAGYRLDDRYKVRDRTKKVIIFELLKA
jgi:tRNA(Ile)-lysidine synthase